MNTGTTPKVQYSYASGSTNTIRITGMTYPNGRNVVDDYGTAGSIDDACSRIRAMKDFGASTSLVDYSYLGLGGFVKTAYPESSIQYTLIGTTGGTNPDSGDIYLGIDRFGRVTDANWANTAGSTTLGRVKYGYDRVSNRTWRDNLSPGMTVGSDELYSYDQLQRLQNLDRGTLNGTQTGITSPTFGQNWTLDETGNWSGFKQDDTGGGTWNLEQIRTANTVNEITTMTNTTSKAWTTPAYDAAGNMTRIPVPGTLPDGVAWNNMSLSEWDNLKLADWDEMTLDNVEAVYDAWNRLVRLHVGDTTLAVYAYDARGYRIRKDSYASGTLSEARHYYYTPGWQVVEERVGSSTTAERQFVWGLRYIDDLVLRDRDTDGNGTPDERRYCLQDGNWNVIAIANTSGTVTERFSYDAYGVPTFLTSGGTVQTSSATGWETLYAGYRWDGDPSKMYYVRNRFLLPCVGSWNRRDPIGYVAGDENLYRYVANFPTNQSDPTGLWSWKAHQKFLEEFFQRHPGYEKQFSPSEMARSGVGMDLNCTYINKNRNPQHYMVNGEPSSDPRDNEYWKRISHYDAEHFIIEQVGLARNNYGDKDYDRAESHLAEAFHAAMDSTSPAHAGADGWPTYWTKTVPNIHSPNESTGIETAKHITPELMNETLARMELVWNSFLDEKINFQLPVPPKKAYKCVDIDPSPSPPDFEFFEKYINTGPDAIKF